MKNQGMMLFFILVLFSAGAFAEKKAKCITESGKKWDVLFVRMHNDTIFLKAKKPNGTYFSISGHKSKFKSIEFSDGTSLDFSLSDFPPADGGAKTAESPLKPAEPGGAWSRDIGDFGGPGDSASKTPSASASIFLSTAPEPGSGTAASTAPTMPQPAAQSTASASVPPPVVEPAAPAAAASPVTKTPGEASAAGKTPKSEDSVFLASLAAQMLSGNKSDTSTAKTTSNATAKTAGSGGEKVVKPETVQASLTIETKPSLASISIDNNPVDGYSPLTVQHLTPGKHTVLAKKDSLEAVATVTLKPNKTGTVKLRLKNPNPQKVPQEKAPEVRKQKSRGPAVSLCVASVALFAGSAVSYFLSMNDSKNRDDLKLALDQSHIAGPNHDRLVQDYNKKTNDVNFKMLASESLAGAGLLSLGLGIVFFF